MKELKFSYDASYMFAWIAVVQSIKMVEWSKTPDSRSKYRKIGGLSLCGLLTLCELEMMPYEEQKDCSDKHPILYSPRGWSQG